MLAGTCFAAHAASVDDDLREAARLHKGGDTARAVVIWKSWAERNADAAYNLAVIHQYGDGVALDYAAAMQWYRVAAEQATVRAECRLVATDGGADIWTTGVLEAAEQYPVGNDPLANEAAQAAALAEICRDLAETVRVLLLDSF